MENLLSPLSSALSETKKADSSQLEILLTEYRFLKSPLSPVLYKCSYIPGLTVEVGEVVLFKEQGLLFYFTDSLDIVRDVLATLLDNRESRSELNIQKPFSCFEVVSEMFQNQKELKK
ncbi:hypothetical protein [Leptospira stimsonii]|uniref:Crp/Fnr family transcriptional regulator n=1 Tax=Leptospira stimsonii TaxID=2202203 RepID=A0ABY2MXH3_9LEPT|nr:hypothetical protein [Leptospira stimsonii]TGK10712.1 hypothetical protein EHO98_22610 [Leptospira stimsonii]TGM11002.1 hypothetical protein EHQ90_17195 [Leptospira stimsonii]